MQAQFIGDHGDELAVGGLAPGVVDGIAEVGVQHVHVATSMAWRMARSTLELVVLYCLATLG